VASVSALVCPEIFQNKVIAKNPANQKKKKRKSCTKYAFPNICIKIKSTPRSPKKTTNARTRCLRFVKSQLLTRRVFIAQKRNARGGKNIPKKRTTRNRVIAPGGILLFPTTMTATTAKTFMGSKRREMMVANFFILSVQPLLLSEVVPDHPKVFRSRGPQPSAGHRSPRQAFSAPWRYVYPCRG